MYEKNSVNECFRFFAKTQETLMDYAKFIGVSICIHAAGAQ